MATSVPRQQIPLVVRTEPLSQLVRGFVDSWNRNHPGASQRGNRAVSPSEVRPVGAIHWLAQETGVSATRLDRIHRNRCLTTDLSTADAVVQAMGCPYAFHDGTLEVKARMGGGELVDADELF